MKIYPCAHDVKIKKQLDFGDIPLAYLHGNEDNKAVVITIQEDFANPPRRENVRPYQSFDSKKITLFDENNKPLNSTLHLENKGSKYYVKPSGIISESVIHASEKFTYSVLLHKQDTYQKSNVYNIRLNAADKQIAEALSKICCNNDEKELYPTNIYFNDKTRLPQDFFTQNLSEADFTFVPLDIIGERAQELKITTGQYIDQQLSKHLNLWILDESFQNTLTDIQQDEANYEVAEPQIFTELKDTIEPIQENVYKRFYTNNKWEKLSDKEDKYVEYFKVGGPLQIIHVESKGYVILSHPDIILNSSRYVKLIIEVLIYTYLNTYYQTETRTSFVTDDPIDYFINVNKKYGLCHPQINLLRILSDERFNTELKYTIENVFVSNNAEYSGITRFSDMLFKKVSERLKDHSKGNNMLAYTSEKTLLVYDRNSSRIQIIESGISLRNNGDMTITIDPMFSTRYNIVSPEEHTLTIPSKTGTYLLIYSKDNPKVFSITAGDNMENSVVLAKISITDNLDIKYKDVRILGGGEWSTEPNYEMIDTGNINGRPIRYGSIMIIQLPMRFKTIQKELQSEVEKHVTSGDYPILIFKD